MDLGFKSEVLSGKQKDVLERPKRQCPSGKTVFGVLKGNFILMDASLTLPFKILYLSPPY